MSKLQSFFAYTVGVLLIFMVMATFIFSNQLSKLLVAKTGLKVSPWITGGEIEQRVNRENYWVEIYHPVFRGLLVDRPQGFIQIKWKPLGSLPRQVNERIDWDGDGRSDFHIYLDTVTGESKLIRAEPRVLGVRQVLKLQDAWMVRVNLKHHTR
jgi:hypothetical protein